MDLLMKAINRLVFTREVFANLFLVILEDLRGSVQIIL